MDYLVNLNLNRNELQNAVIQPLGTAPSPASEGQIYYDSSSGDKQPYYYNGTSWLPFGAQKTSTTPKMNGTAAIGTETKYAAGDHVHPSDTTKADKSTTVTDVAWDSTNNKFTKTINGTTSNIVTAADLRTGLNVADGAEVNQNAFSNVKVGSTTIAADSKTDTIELVAGDNITLTPDATNDKVTIAATDTTYTAGTSSALETGTSTTQSTWTPKILHDYVTGAIEDLPEPMVFKGSLGTGGTITTLPTASSSNEGFTYKVITAGTYASQSAKIGDTFISDGTQWVLIPSGDEPSGTVTSVGISNGGLISVSGSPITTSGTITLTHGTPSGASSIGTAGFYKIKTDSYGHVNGTTAVAKSDITGLLGDYVTSVNGSTGAVTIGTATQSSDGLMSAEDKTTLDNLEAASQGAITYTSLTIATGNTEISASGVASKLITFQAYMGGEAVVVDYDGSVFSIATAQSSDIIIKCVVTV